MPLPFQVTTTTYGGAPIVKPFAWSYSKLKNYRSCPKKHYHVDIAKDFKEEEGQALQFGNEVHSAMAARIEKNKPLPPLLQHFEPDAARVAVNVPGMILLVEQNMAIRQDFTSCGYFDNGVWYRAKCDVVKVLGPAGVAIDWKTGKIQEDSEQLALMAQCVFSKYPQVQKVRTEYVWLGNSATTRVDFTRPMMVDLWNHLLPELAVYENAVKTTTFPPKPGGLCRSYCPVASCPYYKVGSPR